MATIAVLVDEEEGHILPSFWLLRHLKSRGDRVCYLGPPGAERLVKSQGFDFVPIMEDIGSKFAQCNRQAQKSQQSNLMMDVYFGPLVRGEVLDEVIAELQPSVIIILSLYRAEALAIRYRYRLPVVFFSPSLENSRGRHCEKYINMLMNLRSGAAELFELLTEAGVRFRSLPDLVQLVLGLPELVLLPESFDLPGRREEPRGYYVGAGVDISREEAPFSWTSVDLDRPIIYCTRGSQPQIRYEDSLRYFQVVIDSAASRPDWQFIIALSKFIDTKNFSTVPSNVILYDWVPQLEVLSRSDVMVNHGGFGTVKECVLMRVPMVVIPISGFRDHYNCAERVTYHRLGVHSDLSQVSSSGLVMLIENVLNDQSFKHHISLMREKFMLDDRLDLAVEVIEHEISNWQRAR